MNSPEIITLISCEPYYTFEEFCHFVENHPSLKNLDRKLYLSLPMSFLQRWGKRDNSNFLFGVSDFAALRPKSFSAPIAKQLLSEVGIDFVFINSRKLQAVVHLDEKTIHQELCRSFELNIAPILCLDAAKALDWDHQLKIFGQGLSAEKLSKIILYCQGGRLTSKSNYISRLAML